MDEVQLINKCSFLFLLLIIIIIIIIPVGIYLLESLLYLLNNYRVLLCVFLSCV